MALLVNPWQIYDDEKFGGPNVNRVVAGTGSNRYLFAGKLPRRFNSFMHSYNVLYLHDLMKFVHRL